VQALAWGEHTMVVQEYNIIVTVPIPLSIILIRSSINNMKNKFAILVLVSLIIPQFALAAWWNPFSWSIFSGVFSHNTKTVQIATSTNIASVIASQSASSSSFNVTKTILCNGQYWNECPEGQLLVCPTDTTNEAYCSVPKTPKTKTTNVIPVNPKSSTGGGTATQAKVKSPTNIVTPTPPLTAKKTFILSNGSVVDESGNIISLPTIVVTPTPFQTQIVVDDNTVGINYYKLKKTCIGLSGSQYSSCINYAFGPEVQAQEKVAQEASNLAAQQKANEDAKQAKESRINAINLEIANLNAKYMADIAAVKSAAVGRGITTGGLAPQLNAIDAQYKIDYNNLTVKYQQILYGN